MTEYLITNYCFVSLPLFLLSLGFIKFILFILFGLLAVFIPDFFIRPFLDRLKNPIKNMGGYALELPWLKYVPKIFGRVERGFIFLILALFSNSMSGLFNFIAVFIGIKLYVENKIWTKEEHPHIARAQFLIYLMGNILSLASVLIIFFVFNYLIGYCG